MMLLPISPPVRICPPIPPSLPPCPPLQRAAAISGPVAAGIAEALAGAIANATGRAVTPASQHRGDGSGSAASSAMAAGTSKGLPPPPPPLPWFFDGLSPSSGLPVDGFGRGDDDGTSVSSSIDRLLYGSLLQDASGGGGQQLRNHRLRLGGGGLLQDLLGGGGGEASLSSVSSLSEGGLAELLDSAGVDFFMCASIKVWMIVRHKYWRVIPGPS